MSWRRTPLRTLTVISLMLAYTQCSAFTYTHTHTYTHTTLYTLIQNMRAHSQRFVPLLHPPAWPRPSSQLRTTVTTLMLGAMLMRLPYTTPLDPPAWFTRSVCFGVVVVPSTKYSILFQVVNITQSQFPLVLSCVMALSLRATCVFVLYIYIATEVDVPLWQNT